MSPVSVLKVGGGVSVGTDHRGRGGVGSEGWSPGTMLSYHLSLHLSIKSTTDDHLSCFLFSSKNYWNSVLETPINPELVNSPVQFLDSALFHCSIFTKIRKIKIKWWLNILVTVCAWLDKWKLFIKQESGAGAATIAWIFCHSWNCRNSSQQSRWPSTKNLCSSKKVPRNPL